jgi:hypothetical protein
VITEPVQGSMRPIQLNCRDARASHFLGRFLKRRQKALNLADLFLGRLEEVGDQLQAEMGQVIGRHGSVSIEVFGDFLDSVACVVADKRAFSGVRR